MFGSDSEDRNQLAPEDLSGPKVQNGPEDQRQNQLIKFNLIQFLFMKLQITTNVISGHFKDTLQFKLITLQFKLITLQFKLITLQFKLITLQFKLITLQFIVIIIQLNPIN